MSAMLCFGPSLPVSGHSAPNSRRPISVRGRSAVNVVKGAVLERPMDIELVAAPAFDLLTTTQFDQDFQEYKSATRKMADLEQLSQELLTNLQELNSAADALGAMQQEQQEQEARRAKRAAAREARKSEASSRASASAHKQLAVLERPPAVRPRSVMQVPTEERVATRSSSAALSASSTPLQRANLAVAVPEQTSSRFMAGPSLLPARPSASAMDIQAEPSARAREANARRAGVHGRRGPAAPGAFGDASKLQARQQSGADGTAQFMKKAATLDLLSGVSEKELTAIVKDLLFLEGLKKDIKAILKREPTMEEWARAVNMDEELFAARISAGQQAKVMMLQANYRLVISVCKKYQNRGIALQDLIAEGVQGLLKGVEKFDADKGFRFSTYAHWWIRQAVTRSLSDQSRTVRLPAHMYELLMRIKAVKARLVDELGKEPSIERLSAEAGVTVDKIKEVMQMTQASGSLDTPMGDEDGMASMKDMLQDERSTPDEVLEEVMLQKDLISILSELTEREAGVIRLRFGLEGEDELTLGEIGDHFNVTRERIRQIEAKAVRKLKLKQREREGILQEYSSSAADTEVAGRNSRGTNKSK